MGEKRNVYLIGPMGSGKTAVGKQLARKLGLEFVDSDAEIERRTGVDITFIFEKEGETRFRERERTVIAELTSRENLVVATGGGTVIDAENRRNLADHGIVVYLRAGVEQQLRRTRNAKNRPLLLEGDPHETLTRLMTERAPLYEELATFSVNTGGQRVATVVADILDSLRRHGMEPLKKR